MPKPPGLGSAPSSGELDAGMGYKGSNPEFKPTLTV
jgi:hypothetical protein